MCVCVCVCVCVRVCACFEGVGVGVREAALRFTPKGDAVIRALQANYRFLHLSIFLPICPWSYLSLCTYLTTNLNMPEKKISDTHQLKTSP